MPSPEQPSTAITGTSLNASEIVSKWNEIGSALERPAFVQFFDTFRSSAFRWESFSSYKLAAEEPLLKQYAANETRPDAFYAGWERTIEAATSAGKNFLVSRLIPSSPSSYFDLEVDWSYTPFERVGQTSRFILPGQASEEMRLMARHDFWLFDDETVILMQYSDSGEPLGRRIATLTDNPEVVNYFINFSRRILNSSVDLITLKEIGWERAPRHS